MAPPIIVRMAPALFACPGCACHVRASEACCPLCGAELPRTGLGPVPRTAAAVALGLAALASVPGCSEETASSDYGSGPGAGGSAGNVGATGSGGAGGAGGDGTTSATTAASTTAGGGGAGGEDITAEYGIGPTGGGSGG